VNSQLKPKHKPRTTYAAADARASAEAASAKQTNQDAKMGTTKLPFDGGGGGDRPSWLGHPKMPSAFTPAAEPSGGSGSGAAVRARLYAGAATTAATIPNPVADDDDEMEVEEYGKMPALETEDSWERERNKRYDWMLAKSRRESEALDVAQKRDMVDGFFDYNPHTTSRVHCWR